MSKVKLSYFNGRGMGECARLLLSYGKQEFEDHRIEWNDWSKLKPLPEYVFGQLPVLEIDGKVYAQSLAISRYLGRKYGLDGATLEEDLEIDQNVLFLNDVRQKTFEYWFEKTEEAKKKKQEDNVPVLSQMMEKLNELVVKNKGYMALGKLTWADFVFASWYKNLVKYSGIPDMDTKYQVFKKLHDTVYALPGVKEFAAKQPDTEY